MLAHHQIHQQHLDTIDHFHACGELAVETVGQFTALSLRHLRDTAQTHAARALAFTDGDAQGPVDLDHALATFAESMQLMSARYTRWVALAEAQLRLTQRAAHAHLDELQRWTPAGAALAIDAAERMTDAAESSAELLAEGSMALSRSVEAAASAPRTRRPGSRSKAA